MSDLGFNVWGTVAAVISLGALVPTLVIWFLARMPTAKLRSLETLLAETEAMFGKAAEQGVFTREAVLHEFNLSLWALNLRVDDKRVEVYEIRDWKDEVRGWYEGLSGDMDLIREDIYALRTRLAKTSSRERRAMEAAGRISEFVSWSWLGTGRRLMSAASDTSATLLPTSSVLGHESTSCVDDVHSSRPSIVGRVEASTQFFDGCSSTNTATRGIPSPCKGDCGTHRLISDADLSALLLRAARAPTSPARDRRRRRATQQDLLLRFGRQLYGPSALPSRDQGVPHRYAKRARFRAVSRLLRRMYGVQLPDYAPSAAPDTSIDVEVLKSRLTGVANSSEEGDGWYNV